MGIEQKKLSTLKYSLKLQYWLVSELFFKHYNKVLIHILSSKDFYI